MLNLLNLFDCINQEQINQTLLSVSSTINFIFENCMNVKIMLKICFKVMTNQENIQSHRFRINLLCIFRYKTFLDKRAFKANG